MNPDDDVQIEVVDSREAALLLHVTSKGSVRLHHCLPAEKVPAVLRDIADKFEADL